MQLRMRHRHLFCAGIRGGGIAPVTGPLRSGDGRLVCRVRGWRLVAILPEHVVGGLGDCTEDHSAQSLEGGILALQLGLHQRHGIDDAGQGRVFFYIQDRAGALQDGGNSLLLNIHDFQ